MLGVLAASVTYQSGLKPPGGLWQDNNNGHIAGDSILRDIAKGRYRAFFYSNSTSFMASIVVIVLLLPVNKHKFPLWPMHTAILLDMLGLLGAYAAGSTREWEMSRNVIALVVPVLAYIAAYAAVSFFSKKGSVPKEILHEQSQ
uniref:PGG domain-containing protein n=1 Tax=Aegilops tauschii subsp. strangulata TaxID=200361 RepID=A0A453RD88_AEGTS